jgi:hypothetical protein
MPATCHARYPIRSGDDVGSPVVGRVTLEMAHRHERVDDLDMSDVGGDGGRTLPPGFSFDEAAPRRDDSTDSGSRVSAPVVGGDTDADDLDGGVGVPPAATPSRHAERKRGLHRTDSVKWKPDGGVDLDVAAQSKAIQNYIDLEEETRRELERQLERAPPEDKKRLKANIKVSDERMEMLVQQMLKLEGFSFNSP